MRLPALTATQAFFVAALYIFSESGISEPLNVTFLHNNSPAGQQPNDKVSDLLRHIIGHIPADQLTSRFKVVGRGREWQLMQSGEEVCAYNKIKNPERASKAVFSDYPVSVFPPNRLITKAPNTLPDMLTLNEVTEQHNMVVGFDQNRGYGPRVDAQLAALSSNLYPITGEDSDIRLSKMFLDGKIDALIEFTMSFESRLRDRMNEEIDMKHYSIHQISGASTPLYGFIACANTDHGRRVIALLNDAMSLPDVQDYMLKMYEDDFPEREFLFLLPELLLQYGIKHH